MFIYEFKPSTGCLISKIMITGSSITLYMNKKNAQELLVSMQEFGLTMPQMTDIPEHALWHHPTFDKKFERMPHVHYLIGDEDNALNLDYIRNIFDGLLKKQKSLELKKADHHQYLAIMNEERTQKGYETFPKDVQEIIDSYDLNCMYVPEQELYAFYLAFKNHIQGSFNQHVDSIEAQLLSLIEETDDFIYQNMYLTNDKISQNLSESEKHLCEFYNALKTLRLQLLITENKNPLDEEVLTLIYLLLNNPNIHQHVSLLKDLRYFNALPVFNECHLQRENAEKISLMNQKKPLTQPWFINNSEAVKDVNQNESDGQCVCIIS